MCIFADAIYFHDIWKGEENYLIAGKRRWCFSSNLELEPKAKSNWCDIPNQELDWLFALIANKANGSGTVKNGVIFRFVVGDSGQ